MERISNLNRLFVFYLILLLGSCTLERIDPQCPTITSINPATARAGEIVTVTGTNFVAGLSHLYEVKIGDKAIDVNNIKVPDSKTLQFTVPPGIGDGSISISLGGSVCNVSNKAFIYQFKVTEIKQLASGFNSPGGLDVDALGNIILADRFNHIIRQISPTGDTTTIAGNRIAGSKDKDEGRFVNFNTPEDVAIDAAGNIFVADYFNHCIRKIASDIKHNVSTVVGTIGSPGDNDGTTPLNSKLDRPKGVTLGEGNSILTLEYTKNKLRYVNFTNNSITTLINGSPGLVSPTRVVYSTKRNPQFPVLIADAGNKRILEVSTNHTSSNTPIVLAFSPQDLAVDQTGNIFVLDKAGRKVYIIYKDNSIREFAGFGINYELKAPSGLGLDMNNRILYISDEILNNVVSVKYQ